MSHSSQLFEQLAPLERYFESMKAPTSAPIGVANIDNASERGQASMWKAPLNEGKAQGPQGNDWRQAPLNEGSLGRVEDPQSNNGGQAPLHEGFVACTESALITTPDVE